jgi:hypothetical protein
MKLISITFCNLCESLSLPMKPGQYRGQGAWPRSWLLLVVGSATRMGKTEQSSVLMQKKHPNLWQDQLAVQIKIPPPEQRRDGWRPSSTSQRRENSREGG